MNTTRVGKIGRLPKGIRDELGRRIEDGEPGKDLVQWLNGLPKAQKILEGQFNGRAITEQNLSEWKQNGHVEWLRGEENRELAGRLAEQSDGLDKEAPKISDRVARVLTVELARLALDLVEKESEPGKRWARLCQANRQLSRLRRDDHRALRVGMAIEQWKRQADRDEAEESAHATEEAKQRIKDMHYGLLRVPTVAKMFGGGKEGLRIAKLLYQVEHEMPNELQDDPPLDDLEPPAKTPAADKPDPG